MARGFRRRELLGSTALAGLALSGCQLNPFQKPPADQVLRLPLQAYRSLDPVFALDLSEVTNAVHVFSGLTGINEKLEVVGDLAERWQLSQDGRTYTFALRKGLRFHDGRDLRAADVKYSLDRAAGLAGRSSIVATYLGDIAGFADRAQGKAAELSGVRVRDDQTIEISLDQPKVYFPAKLTHPVSFAVDRNNVENGGPNWWSKPNGSGPFRVREAKPNESFVLARNDSYHSTKPALTDVYFIPVLGLESYEVGQVDITQPELDDIERVTDKSDPLSKELTVKTGLDTRYLAFNVTAKPFDDPKVRQAFTYALDRDKIANVTFKKTVIKADTILPPGMPGRTDKAKAPDFDVSKARQLIAESTYRDVKNFPEVVLTIAGNRTDAPPYIQAIVAMYKQNLGVDAKVRQMDYDSFMTQITKSPERLQMHATGWVADYPDPENFLDLLFHSSGPENHTLYANPDVDRILERARSERDTAARMRLYSEAEAQILRDAPWVVLFHSKEYWLAKPYVQGLSVPPLAQPWLRSISIKGTPKRAPLTTTQQGG